MTIRTYSLLLHHNNENIFYYGNNTELLSGVGKIYKNDPKFYQITVYKNSYPIPDWFKKQLSIKYFRIDFIELQLA